VAAAAAAVVPQAMAFAGFNGLGLALLVPCCQSLIADLYTAEHRGRAFGTLQLTASLGGMLGGECVGPNLCLPSPPLLPVVLNSSGFSAIYLSLELAAQHAADRLCLRFAGISRMACVDLFQSCWCVAVGWATRGASALRLQVAGIGSAQDNS